MLNLPKKISSLIKKQDRKIDCLLGKITNLKQIGQGGNGIVYEGLLHSKPIAIKFFTKLDSTNKLTRFKAEYFNIVLLPANEMTTKYINFDILDIDEQKIPYIIMDKYDKTLKNLREEENKPNIDELFNFLLDSVEFIHNNKVIHRDLKPQNIFYKNGKFVLGDFGIAHFDKNVYNLKGETKKSDRMANFEFSAPEQLTKESKAAPTMDIYAIGQLCQWYETGKIHKGTNRQRIENRDIDQIIEKCLADEPNERPQTIKEIRELIKKILN